HDLILDIDVQGAQQIKEKLKRGIFIFIFPPSYEELKKRLQRRGENELFIQKRLRKAGKEIRAYSLFNYLVINDNLKEAVMDLKSIILANRCRLERQTKKALPVLQSFSED
ncbi:MAG: guanylate kinase, partial [Acidobacteriota bacterium]